jgi:hypothetical protein
MYYRCIRFNTNEYKIQVRDTIRNRAKGIECAENWRTGLSGLPPDSVRCTRAIHSKPATLGNSRVPSAIIHWTVR